ncbi:LysR family transcriptional regulator [Gemella cuniculi]|uniref:LysR family transcriptional regulator n=1 Tax=Gemella cuniculi TaxID=150240 RepID=UPI000428CCB1|nr:LysR family transcriptional regulator [Gemella cuniculi]
MEYETILNYINAVLKHKNISKAANELYISQPYLSKTIKNIETNLGIKIFNRNTSEINLTFAGERYYHYLSELNKIERKMINELEFIKMEKKGKIKLGINSALATSFLYKVIPEFNKNNPDIIIELVEKNQNISEEMLLNHQLDLVIGMSPIFNDSLSYNIIFNENMYLHVHNKSNLFSPKSSGITKFTKDYSLLSSEPMILTPLEYGIGKTIKQFFEKNNLELNTILTTSTIPTAVNFSKTSMGATFIPEAIIDDYIDEKCNIYSFNKRDIKAEYVVIYRKNEILPRAVNNLLNTILCTLKRK